LNYGEGRLFCSLFLLRFAPFKVKAQAELGYTSVKQRPTEAKL